MEIDRAGSLLFHTGDKAERGFIEGMTRFVQTNPTRTEAANAILSVAFDPEIVNPDTLRSIHDAATDAHIGMIREQAPDSPYLSSVFTDRFVSEVLAGGVPIVLPETFAGLALATALHTHGELQKIKARALNFPDLSAETADEPAESAIAENILCVEDLMEFESNRARDVEDGIRISLEVIEKIRDHYGLLSD